MKKLATLKMLFIFTIGFSFLVPTVSCGGKKHKNRRHKKYKKDKKNKIPNKTLSDAKHSTKNMGKFLFAAAYYKDFSKVKSIRLKLSESRDFAKPELFKKYASKDKMKEKFEIWTKMFKDGKYKKIKEEGTEEIKPGDASNPKFKELANQITKPIKIKKMKIISKYSKCSFIAIKMQNNEFRLLRLKGCKTNR